MHIGIMGLPGSGKTTVFNVLARARAQVAGYSAEPNRAVVKVPDPRLDRLAALFQPKKVTPAEVQYVDVAGLVQGGPREGAAAILGSLRTADVLLHVVRAFPGPLGEPQPLQDVEGMEVELGLADLIVVEKRLERLEKEFRLGRGTPSERQQSERELALLGRIKGALDEGRPIRQLELGAEEERLVRGYGFLSAKPLLVLLNTQEPDESQVAQVQARLQGPAVDVVALAGKLEMELGELEPEEAQQFMAELGIAESGLTRVIQRSYRLARQHSFFTVGPDEVKAWTIPV
ncbi:MAG: redox-regulated ATPase YchF, partial [Chloroflexi bacterium]|nr:redox-regulated ATPase YchF [Chloroflexota bacterium]